MYLIFVTSLTWYIFTRFGGVLMNASTDNMLGGFKAEPTVFCQQPRKTSSETQTFFYWLLELRFTKTNFIFSQKFCFCFYHGLNVKICTFIYWQEQNKKYFFIFSYTKKLCEITINVHYKQLVFFGKFLIFVYLSSIYSGSHGGFWYILFLAECFILIVMAIRDLSRQEFAI